MFVIVDYGCGNLGSIRNMLARIGVDNVVATNDAARIQMANKIILPGVGSFDSGMSQLRQLGLESVLNHQVLGRRVPVLGICLGMQLLFNGSDEGVEPGLGWIPGRVVRFEFEKSRGLKVPHMGWNTVEPSGRHRLFEGQHADFAFYFVHSYYAVCDDKADVAGWTSHGVTFASAVVRDNVWGVQFHPEKSHKFGMQLLRNFVRVA